MKAFFAQSLLGLVLSAAGIQTIYIYVKGLDSGASVLLLLLALVLIVVGFYLLMRAGKTDVSVFKRLKNFKTKNANAEESLAKSLQKNDQLTNQWSKTVEKRDKLKMLEISSAANAEADTQ